MGYSPWGLKELDMTERQTPTHPGLRKIVQYWHLSLDCFYSFSKAVMLKKKKNFSLFSELRLEGHDRSRLAKVTWVSSSKGRAPGGGEPSVAVPVVGGSWLG